MHNRINFISQLTYLLLILFLFTNFSNIKYPIKNPPGTIRIAENLFCDQNEISNLSWQEYQFWIARVFGVNSNQYRKTMPDTSIFKRLDSCLASHIQSYWKNPKYRNYPVVGINRQQALDFSAWRSDRVMEYILVKKKIINWSAKSNALDYFSIEKYLKGEFQKMKPDTSIHYIPRYTLMSETEEKLIYRYNDSVKIKTPESEVKNYAFNCSKLKFHPMPLQEEKKPIKKYKHHIFNLMGNVAEWNESENQPPYPLVGFRNTFHWEKIN
jgi:hypothetical protein